MRGIEKRDALVEFIRTGKVLRETLIKSHTGVGEAEKWLESLFEFGRRQLNMAQNNAIRSAELTPGDSFEMHLGTIHAFSAANYSEVAGRLMAQLRELEKVKDSIVD